MPRRPDGIERIEKLEASPEAKRRARVIAEVMGGMRSVGDACAELDLGATQFDVIFEAFLLGGLPALEPKAAGRPPKVVSEEEKEIARLQGEVHELRAAIVTAHLREELAIALPHLGKRGKKGRRLSRK